MGKKKIWKRCVSVLLSLVICLSLMAPTLGENTSSSSDSEVETTTTVTAETTYGNDTEEAESEEVLEILEETETKATSSESDDSADADTTEYGTETDSEVESIEALSESDFTSQRLIVMTSDSASIGVDEQVLGVYGNVYLIQYDSVEAAMEAYLSYLEDTEVDAVEPDMTVEIATDTDTVGAEIIQMTEEDNPIATLSDMETSDEIINAQDIIALIDTGAEESENIVDRVSVIDDQLSGNGHANEMVAAIISENPEAQILSIRAINDSGFGTISGLVAAMEYAIEQKVDIINLSLYARATLSTSVLKEEILKATEAGIIVVGAAGNDGANVKDYIPGSVEEAYVIGAADESGNRQTLSNYGETVDYNVAAETTSEATAIFTGFISKNGLDAVQDVLNNGLIFSSSYNEEETSDDDPSEDQFSEYVLDESKIAVIRYTFVYADKLEDGDTIDSLFEKYAGNLNEIYMTTIESKAELYAVGDGTYKFRADGPLKNGFVVGDKYTDIVFARGNNDGIVLTDGVSMDPETGIATVSEDLLYREEGDFSDIQVQVLVPVDSVPYATQSISVENINGETYTINAEINGLINQDIELAITGTNENLTSDDFAVYINGNRIPSDATWNEETHKITLVNEKAASIYSIRIRVLKETDSVFQVAALNGTDYEVTHSTTPLFYLAEGTDVSGLYVGLSVSATSRQGMDGSRGYSDAYTCATYIGSVSGDLEGYDYAHSGATYIGIPKNLFGINFQAYDASGTSYGSFMYADGVVYSDYNTGIYGWCHHASKPIDTSNATRWTPTVTYTILDKWESGGYTYFIMSMLCESSIWSNGQSTGGVFVFAVKNKGYAQVLKSTDSSYASIASASNELSLAGAVYGIYTASTCYFQQLVGTVTTDSTGYSDTLELSPGTYYVKELRAPTGYTLDTSTVQTCTVTAGNTTTVSFSNVPVYGTIRVQKSSTDSTYTASLAGAVFEILRNDGVRVTTITTDSSGYGEAGGIPYGTYTVREITAPEGYLLDTQSYTVTIPDYIYTGSQTHSNGTMLVMEFNKSGRFYFELRNENGYSGQTLTAYVFSDNDDPSGNRPYLALTESYRESTGGTFYYATFYAGYMVNGGSGSNNIYIHIYNGSTFLYAYTISADNFINYDPNMDTYFGSWYYTVNVAEEPSYGWIELYKASSNTTMTDGNSMYSLEGAVYGVYSDSSCTNLVTTMTTNASGYAFSGNLTRGTYYVKEITASPGYELDPTVYTVEVEAAVTVTVNVNETPANDPVGIEITKIYETENENLTGYWSDMSGAQFTIKYYAGQYSSLDALPDTPTRTWVIETQYDESSGLYLAALDDAHKVSGDDYYYDSNGTITLPLGTITIEETLAPWGFTMEGGWMTSSGQTVSSEDGIILLNIEQNGSGGIGQVTAGNYYTKGEPFEYCSITLLKQDETKSALAGASFTLEIWNEETQEWDVLKTGTTGDDGKLAFDELVFGTYRITETETANGYSLLTEPIIVELPYSSEDGYTDSNPTFTRDGVYYYCDISYTIDNSPTFSLPVTGISGISVIPVVGAGILAAVVCLFFMTRKRKAY